MFSSAYASKDFDIVAEPEGKVLLPAIGGCSPNPAGKEAELERYGGERKGPGMGDGGFKSAAPGSPTRAKHGHGDPASISTSRDWRSSAREVIMDILLGGDGSAVSSCGEKVPLGQSSQNNLIDWPEALEHLHVGNVSR